MFAAEETDILHSMTDHLANGAALSIALKHIDCMCTAAYNLVFTCAGS